MVVTSDSPMKVMWVSHYSCVPQYLTGFYANLNIEQSAQLKIHYRVQKETMLWESSGFGDKDYAFTY